MGKRKINYKEELNNYFFILFSVFVLLLTFINISNITAKKEVRVLGAQSEDNSKFWEDLLEKHPTYRDGWVELGRIDKIKQIDPNYFQP